MEEVTKVEKFRATADGPELTFTQTWRSGRIPVNGELREAIFRGCAIAAEPGSSEWRMMVLRYAKEAKR